MDMRRRAVLRQERRQAHRDTDLARDLAECRAAQEAARRKVERLLHLLAEREAEACQLRRAADARGRDGT